MNPTIIIDALALPTNARVDQRIHKKLLIEQGTPTPADKRQIQNGIEELLWIAALKQTNIGVPVFKDNIREYLEISVLSVTLRAVAKAPRLIELVHRAIPYPVVLITIQNDVVSLSLAHKRWSQGEAGKVVIEDVRSTAPFRPGTPSKHEAEFLANISISGLPGHDMFTLYQGWLDRIAALESAEITGKFTAPHTPDQAIALRNSLDTRVRLLGDIIKLRTRAEKEKQINRRVELNLEIKRMEAELAIITKKL